MAALWGWFEYLVGGLSGADRAFALASWALERRAVGCHLRHSPAAEKDARAESASGGGVVDCMDGGGGGQQVIVVTISERSIASFAIVDHNYDPLIELRGECDNAESVIQCNDDSNGLASRIPRNDGTIVLEPGIYYLYIDGFGGRMGTGTVEIQIQPAN